jgi:hypothetical protein
LSRKRSKLHRALQQEARRIGATQDAANAVADKVLGLTDLCGEQSHSSQMKFRIGAALIRGSTHIIAPACPDYTHEKGKYTFRGVGGGVSLLAGLQIRFLERVASVFSEFRATFLIADHEADDKALCKAVGKSQEEFLGKIRESARITREVVRGRGWDVRLMTDVIPDLVAKEEIAIELIRADEKLRARIVTDTIARSKMYRRIGDFTIDEQIERTIRTAAQYRVVAEFATQENLLVCNHSTVNLSWYREAGTAVLHNSVSVY